MKGDVTEPNPTPTYTDIAVKPSIKDRGSLTMSKELISQRRSRRSGAGWRLALVAAALSIALVQPAAASTETMIGGGEADGVVTFGGAGVPPLGLPCQSVSFDINGQSRVGAAYNTYGDAYAGSSTLKGKGSGSCESASSGGGDLTLTDVRVTDPTYGLIDCANPDARTKLTGTYQRVGPDVTAITYGNCHMGGHSTPVKFYFRGEFFPTNQGGGLSAPITDATFVGAYVFMPQ